MKLTERQKYLIKQSLHLNEDIWDEEDDDIFSDEIDDITYKGEFLYKYDDWYFIRGERGNYILCKDISNNLIECYLIDGRHFLFNTTDKNNNSYEFYTQRFEKATTSSLNNDEVSSMFRLLNPETVLDIKITNEVHYNKEDRVLGSDVARLLTKPEYLISSIKDIIEDYKFVKDVWNIPNLNLLYIIKKQTKPLFFFTYKNDNIAFGLSMDERNQTNPFKIINKPYDFVKKVTDAILLNNPDESIDVCKSLVHKLKTEYNINFRNNIREIIRTGHIEAYKAKGKKPNDIYSDLIPITFNFAGKQFYKIHTSRSMIMNKDTNNFKNMTKVILFNKMAFNSYITVNGEVTQESKNFGPLFSLSYNNQFVSSVMNYTNKTLEELCNEVPKFNTFYSKQEAMLNKLFLKINSQLAPKFPNIKKEKLASQQMIQFLKDFFKNKFCED